MRLGIYAPFNRSETTSMAVRLASMMKREGWSVSWLANTRSTPAHPYWDDQVRVATDARVAEWSVNTDARVWFWPDRGRFDMVRKIAAKDKANPLTDVFVPPIHSITGDDLAWMKFFDMVVCPDRNMMTKLERLVDTLMQLRVCVWPAGVSRQLRLGFTGETGPTVTMVADAYTGRTAGHEVMEAVAALLAAVPTMQLSVALDYALDRREHRTLDVLLDRFGDRFCIAGRPPVDRLLCQIRQSDWLIYGNLRTSSGLLVKQAQSLGVPSVCWGVNPLNVLARDGVEGISVPCRSMHTIAGAETAQWDTPALVAACATALPDAQLLCKLQTYCYQRAGFECDETFTQFWHNALELQPV